jgi:hypothetical protein
VNQNIYATGYFSDVADFGYATTLTSAGSTDIFLAGYTQSGQLLFAKSAGGTTDDWANSLATDAKGFVYLTGYYTGTVSFIDPGNNHHKCRQC